MAPPHIVVPIEAEAPQTPPPEPTTGPEEPRRIPVPVRPRAPQSAETAKPIEELPKPAPASPPPPTTTLQTTPAAAQGEVERAIRATMTKATTDLNRIDYRALNRDARNQYDTAKRFVQQADEAIGMKNLPFAKNLADKAAVLAAQLAPR